jgi:hypothetical protein
LWQKLRGREGFFYEVNLENPILKAVLSNLTQDKAEQVLGLLSLLSRQFPLLDAYQEMAGNQLPEHVPWSRDELFSRLMMLKASGVLPEDPKQTIVLLSKTEPFDSFGELEELVRGIWSSDAS